MNVSPKVLAGQAVYSRAVLAVYDLWVLGISNTWIWKCPSSTILAHFNQHISGNHLDVGVGTGYFLDHCRFPTSSARVALMDLNANSLAVAARRLRRYDPEVYEHNVLEPAPSGIPAFQSISINYLLHCLPGTIAEKVIAFHHLDTLLYPDGVIFGSTILQGDVHRSAVAQRLMDIYNRKGIFSNAHDERAELEQYLARRYAHYEVTVQGCVALFWAQKRISQ